MKRDYARQSTTLNKTMTDYEYLIHLLYCTIHGTQPAEKPEGVSFKNVLDIGKMHEVANIAFLSVDRLTEKPSSEVYRDWQMIYFFSVQRDARQQALYADVTGLLHANGIRTLEAQGTVTKTLYPSPEWRMMSDLDFIIDREKLPQAHALLSHAGYTVATLYEDGFSAEKGNLEVELHSDFFTRKVYGREANYAKAIHNAFLHAAPDAENPMKYILEDTYYYLFSVLHTIKHFETAGCGIRRVMDLYYLKKALGKKMDDAYVQQVLERHDFQTSYHTLLALEAMWFEGVAPETDLSDAVRTVLTSGNHGTRERLSHNTIRTEQRAGVRFPTARRIRCYIFPSKEWIYENYPVCREHDYSYATAWLYRLFQKLKDGKLKTALQYIHHMLRAKRGQ